jgi:NAD+ kinase
LKKLDFKRIGLTGNAEKPDFGRVVRKAAALIARTGRAVLCDADTARVARLKTKPRPDAAGLTRVVDLLLVFGGDGTMLRIARETAGSLTPILGINIGGLGFLATVSSSQLPRALERIWRGEFRLETRTLIEARSPAPGGRSPSGAGGRSRRSRDPSLQREALNDFVIVRGATPRLIELEVVVDDELLTRYRCDGLIVSSPTGSTAYSLAAGGALICPTAEVLALTPICPHTLSNRSVIASFRSTVRVKVISPKPAAILSADGQVVSELAEGDVVTVRRSRKAVRLMHLPGASFFQTLRRKLHWRGASL